MSTTTNDINALAALAICESLLLALVERDVINAKEANDVLVDAAAAHRNAMPDAANPGMHEAVAIVIEAIGVAGNSIHLK